MDEKDETKGEKARHLHMYQQALCEKGNEGKGWEVDEG